MFAPRRPVRGYLLADYCTGRFWDLVPNGLGGYVATLHTELAGIRPVAFGEDASGELYVVDSAAGTVSKLGSDPVPVTLMRWTIE